MKTVFGHLKLLLKFRNVLKHTESRSSFACNQNEMKRKVINSPPGKHPQNARGISAEELGIMSKNNLGGGHLGYKDCMHMGDLLSYLDLLLIIIHNGSWMISVSGELKSKVVFFK